MKEWTGNDIKSFRERHNLYQKDLALMVGTSQNYIHMLEKEVRTASKTMRALLDCLEEKYAKKKTKKEV
jgi:predicted transcriptional regulator